jgi:hypothetical protein
VILDFWSDNDHKPKITAEAGGRRRRPGRGRDTPN